MIMLLVIWTYPFEMGAPSPFVTSIQFCTRRVCGMISVQKKIEVESRIIVKKRAFKRVAGYSTSFEFFCLEFVEGLLSLCYHIYWSCFLVDQRKKDDNATLYDHASPYPVNRLAPPIELVDLAREIARADDLLSLQTTGKLQLLAKQMRALQEEARQLLEETRRNQELHRAQCGFKKIAGQVYHLYKREDDSLQFSLLSPRDWHDTQPFQYVGSYRLASDMRWVEVEER